MRRPAMLRRVPFLLLSLLVLLAFAGAAVCAYRGWEASRVNAALTALSEGRDVPVSPGDPLRLIEARASWLLARDRLEEAEALGPLIAAGGDLRAEAAWHYNRGNARLRQAFELIEIRKLDDATPQVNLAKIAYRSALRADPGFYDAKVNLDLAMRLVRDLPREEQDGEEPDEPPKALWTDLPGIPGGLP